MRMTPPNLHASALAEFDGKLRETFCHITGLMPDNDEWTQATCGLATAGLGLRQAGRVMQGLRSWLWFWTDDCCQFATESIT